MVPEKLNERGRTAEPLHEVLRSVRAESGATLLELVDQSPVLLVFLRHFGCSFCRKTISDVAGIEPELRRRGVRPVFVHMGPPEIARAHFEYYGLSGVERVHDPGAALYRARVFQLERKSWVTQNLRPAVMWANWVKGAMFRHGIGKIQGDGNQMPGVFFLRGAEIVRGFRHRSIADEPNYLRLVE